VPKLNHIASIALDPITVGKFYATIFEMTFEGWSAGIGYAAAAREGYVGLNFNPVLPGRPGPIGLDHFGIEVDDINNSFDQARKNYPEVEWIKRSGTRPYAQVDINDPDGQVVNINQRDIDKGISEVKTGGVYLEEDSPEPRPRHVEYLALRTLNPSRCSDFYRDVFEMTPMNRQEDEETYSLTDGRVVLKLIPWRISDFDGMDVNRPMLDHIGFKVEDADKVHEEILDYNGRFPPMAAPCWLLEDREEDRNRAKHMKKIASNSKYQYCDMNGTCFVTND
jgi:catechol 2,3-dioxygenase-like lactoylglutathione lyase family enzyme